MNIYVLLVSRLQEMTVSAQVTIFVFISLFDPEYSLFLPLSSIIYPAADLHMVLLHRWNAPGRNVQFSFPVQPES